MRHRRAHHSVNGRLGHRVDHSRRAGLRSAGNGGKVLGDRIASSSPIGRGADGHRDHVEGVTEQRRVERETQLVLILADGLVEPADDFRGDFIHVGIVVAEPRRSHAALAKRLVAFPVGLQGGQQFSRRAGVVLEHHLLDRRQPVGGRRNRAGEDHKRLPSRAARHRVLAGGETFGEGPGEERGADHLGVVVEHAPAETVQRLGDAVEVLPQKGLEQFVEARHRREVARLGAEMLSDTQFARFVDGIVVPGPRDDALGQRALAPVEQRSLQALGGFGGGEVDQALPVEQQLVAPVAAVVAGQVQRDAVGRHRRDDDLVVEDAAPAGGGQLKLGHLLAERFGRAVVDADVHLRARDH